MSVTIRDVAKRAGVSIATVSRVLNQSKPVSESLRKKIMKAVEETGYRPNAVARSLIHKRTGLVGVIIPEIYNPYFSGLVQGIESIAQQSGYSVMLAVSGKSVEQELEMLQIFQTRQMEGVILASSRWSREHRRWFTQAPMPCVIIGRPAGSLSSVCTAIIDNRKAAYEAVRYLIQLGHRRIGMIRGPKWDRASGEERYAGYRDALREADIPPRRQWVAVREEFQVIDGYQGMKQIAAAKEKPTAVFCACDRIAVGAMQYLEEQGVSVPGDLSIVGFDDEELARIVTPSLTTVRHQPFEMGVQAATMLTEQMLNQQKMGKEAVLPHQLVVRNSTAPPSE
ncbi:catabolite control protein A [Marinithermofilum abyssi]|uniref:Catabolite control protein A n=1 Tax=Marinithermofilum abyssi TaxID=1571185 RepID=A0A8J2YCX7_9BACL|nr:LacI family DNA-binding transcriptional regulator [Marinithermofilum abyssi]GGE19677.1 catabolite control protein A [Marinithermofilum abyssi]